VSGPGEAGATTTKGSDAVAEDDVRSGAEFQALAFQS
jgi:hypothetical protein